jgi:hypothetical protein
MTTTYFNNYDYIRGLFESDGSWGVKTLSLKEKPISFHTYLTFSQKDPTVLKHLLIKLKANKNTKITERSHITKTGNLTTSKSISFVLSNPAAKNLLTNFQSNPPVSPTKYLDYRIIMILKRVNQESALRVVNDLLPNLNLTDLKIASLALLYLRFQMHGASLVQPQAKLAPIEKYYQKLNTTSLELKESIRIGKKLFLPIQQDIKNRDVSNMILKPGYILGLHTGDGTFYTQTQFRSKTDFKVSFGWNITDCNENLPLLKALKNTLETKYDIKFTPLSIDSKSSSYKRLRLSNTNECLKLANLFEEWEARSVFPEVRLNQFEKFLEAIKTFKDPNFRHDKNLGLKYLELKWTMNPGTNSKKKGTFQEEESKLLEYYKTKK